MRISRRGLAFVTLSVLASRAALALAQLSATSPAVPPLTPEAHLIASLRSKIPLEPVALEADPYITWRDTGPPPAPAGTVCGVRFEPDQIHYRLARFDDTAAARTAGYAVTHFGACGTCSSLQDLAVYLEKPDLTAPVRRCGVSRSAAVGLTCLKNLGFSTACAQTWLYNLQNTRHRCLGVCLWSWIEGKPPTGKEGRLNACLQCDEERSGPIFKATAGRTRRNSGIHSSIPRPDDEIAPVVHDYVPDLAPQ
jgi:hypothetical protein